MSHQEVNAIFLAVDQDRSGAIDAAELQAALSKSGFVMSLAAVAQLIRIYDKNNDNRIDLQEFVGLHKFLSKAQAAFAAYAGSITGQLSEDNLKAAIVELGAFGGVRKILSTRIIDCRSSHSVALMYS